MSTILATILKKFEQKKKPEVYRHLSVGSFNLLLDEVGRVKEALFHRGLTANDIINIETTSRGFVVWFRSDVQMLKPDQAQYPKEVFLKQDMDLERLRCEKEHKLPSVDGAGVIALEICSKVEPKLSAQEEAMFIAGFQECVKYLCGRGVSLVGEDAWLS